MQPSQIITYDEMCAEEGTKLQRGMNYHLGRTYSVILMSTRTNAPYADNVQDGGRVLIYEGHDAPNRKNSLDPKAVDQPMHNPRGSLTPNGLFYTSALKFKNGKPPELVKVYEKIRPGIWTYNGFFRLVDAWLEIINHRKVFKFRLELLESQNAENELPEMELDHSRMIPAHVKQEVWKRDKGRCVQCGSAENLHFDHIIPFSKGGSSLVAENIQLLCAKHNLEKRDKIE